MKKCYVQFKKDWVEAEFIGVFQYSNVVGASPMIGGHGAGTIAYPVAVVKIGTILKEVPVSNVIFEPVSEPKKSDKDDKYWWLNI